MNLLKRFYNWDKSFALVSGIFMVIFLGLSTFAFVQYTFFVDYTDDYTELLTIVKQEKENLENDINNFSTGKLEGEYNIEFSREKLSIVSEKESNPFIGAPKIELSIKEKDNKLIIDTTNYTPVNRIFLSIILYLCLVFLSILAGLIFCFVIAIVLEFIFIIIDNRKDRNS